MLSLTERSQMAFVPNPLPPKGVEYESILYRLSNASSLVGQLSGAGRRFSNPYLLVRPLQRKEAVASSAIEGTHTTLSQLLLFEAREDPGGQPLDTLEVRNYVVALEYAIGALESIPISTRLLLGMHERLMANVSRGRGGDIAAGQYKSHQNFIGGSTLESARFVPAPPREVQRLMGELENFLNLPVSSGVPPLIVAALTHYQFEAIHPFADGNGRVGRLLIPLVLKSRGMLSTPLLYVSPYLEEHKDEYIDRLFAVSTTGAWIEWIDFFLRAIEATCEQTIRSIEQLHDMNLAYLDRIQRARNSALLRGLVNHCFATPYVTIADAQSVLGVTYHAARNNLEKLVNYGILTEIQDGKRPRLFFAPEILEAIESR
jgi:Fic family protein